MFTSPKILSIHLILTKKYSNNNPTEHDNSLPAVLWNCKVNCTAHHNAVRQKNYYDFLYIHSLPLEDLPKSLNGGTLPNAVMFLLALLQNSQDNLIPTVA